MSITDELGDALDGGQAAILGGSNVSDLFELPDGSYGRAAQLVRGIANARGFGVLQYSGRRSSFEPLDRSAPRPTLPTLGTPHGQAMNEIVNQLTNSDAPNVLLIDHADLYLPDAPVPVSQDAELLIEMLAMFPRTASVSRHRLVLIDYSSRIESRLERSPGFVRICVGAPSESARGAFLRRLDARRIEQSEVIGEFDPDVGPDRFATLSGGLSLDTLARQARRAAMQQRVVTLDDVQTDRRREIARLGGNTLQARRADRSFADIGGMSSVRLLVQRLRTAQRRGRVIVLAGPPGNGKTLVVEAIAHELALPLVVMGEIRGPFVGQSEQNFRTFFETIATLSPCVVHIDEADQVLGQRDTGQYGDSGVSARMNAQFWEFTGDANAHRVVFVLTTNRPDLLDEALDSRSEFIPVLPPTADEQVQILVLCAQRQGMPVEDAVARDVLDRRRNRDFISGRTIDQAVARAALLASAAGRELIDHASLDESFQLLVDRDSSAVEVSVLRSIAKTSFLDSLPWIAARTLGLPSEVPHYLAPYMSDDGFTPDWACIRERIRALEHPGLTRIVARGA